MKYFAVFGNPINHSISPRLHNLALQGYGLAGFYGRVHLEDGLELINTFNKLELSGANVTVPFKEIVLNQCDEIDETAKSIGSLNTLVKRNGKIFGYNTDAPGFMLAISEFKDIESALILGAGGTARAICYILQKNGIDVEILNRSSSRAQSFKDCSFFTHQDYKPKGYTLVVNTTSAGLADDHLPANRDILKQVLDSSKFAFDVIYNKNTPFLNLAKSCSLTCKDGKDMLLFQAILSFNIFYENKFENEKIRSFMQEALFF
ncbi:shikimate dehydrogenase [Campylobacter fetus]|uniref:Shikimate dehydrogenase (NADP(+)) n=3 Tax=Campylobacter fetus TaxID=196 RepID=A0A5L4XFR5_CAMFE|nr:shikimate dehydrogenase [Campylobacter fetus]OCS22853.1 shikimate dehydrogenase [Campylobacter fetus subsp. venerealis cfvi97/532]OCS26209.1 shikimate dehydrogenase [Campylobacter fetus subsp. venerealis cfvB10]OCS29694.1 shikimate dehydrogenase [Campylobacter fetus subsp. venerealis LMG 6570 = CCUG 33900]OCS43148.1 shikimate dehydrogenase [Campylobacter fetus subsp. venerealis cfvi02/298]ABK82684.1 shikimate 5-dehydrogenase [Campylobacter fetus subsp. fetus 82-40]